MNTLCHSRQSIHLTARETGSEDATHRWWRNVKKKVKLFIYIKIGKERSCYRKNEEIFG
jgi:hypothetical protein